MRDYRYEPQAFAFRAAQWIAAPLTVRARESSRPAGVLPLGEWVCPAQYTRQHLHRRFTVSRRLTAACFEIQCDNQFDLYLNGQLLYSHMAADFCDTGAVDMTSAVVPGENRLALRLFMTSEPRRFLQALRGVFCLRYADGTEERICPDESWSVWNFCNFGQGTEPEDWAVSDTPRQVWAPMLSFPEHPAVMRRSCLFRRRFSVRPGVVRARLAGTACGLYIPRLNGQPVTEERFLPGAMERYKEVQVYDVTERLTAGENVLAAWLGNGWYNCESWGTLTARPLALRMELTVEYTDGTTDCIGTDEEWLTHVSPLLEDDMQFGERYDARLEIPGWDADGLDETGWCAAESVGLATPPLVRQAYPGVQITQRLRAQEIRALPGGRWLVDFGQNLAGRAVLRLHNMEPGRAISIRFCERLTAAGEPVITLYSDVYYNADALPGGRSEAAARNRDVYICRGGETEQYEPQFTYTGFRYVYLENYPEEPRPDTVTFAVQHTALPVNGRIETPCPAIRHQWDMITRSFRGNIVAGPTDCPTREKNFWNGDIQAFAYTACWYMDCFDFLAAWTDAGRKMEYGIYGWEDETYILPLKLYAMYGDRSLLERRYPAMLELVERREQETERDPDYPAKCAPYRDHLALENVPPAFFGQLFRCVMHRQVAEVARILGDEPTAVRLEGAYRRLREQFQTRWYLPQEADYAPRCQGALVLPVVYGLAPREDVPRLADTLAAYVRRANGHATTGFLSTEGLPMLLAEYGHADLAWQVVKQSSYPSLLYLYDRGVTTVPESWNILEPGHEGESLNHYTLGSVGRFFFTYLGGLRRHAPGFSRLRLQPLFIREVGALRVSYRTPLGEVVSDWRFTGETVRWQITVPDGMEATLCPPDGRELACGGGQYTLEIEAKWAAV